jgi:hypothetical protein
MNKHFHIASFGVLIGIGFNIYELNILYGVYVSLLFIGLLICQRDYKGVMILILSLCIGTGPILGYYFKYPQILQVRLRNTHCAINQVSDIWKYLCLFYEFHLKSDMAKYWFPKLAIIPMIIGVLASFKTRNKKFWILYFLVFMGMVGIWISSGKLGRRRAASLIYYEWIYVAIGLQMIINILRKEKIQCQ